MIRVPGHCRLGAAGPGVGAGAGPAVTCCSVCSAGAVHHGGGCGARLCVIILRVGVEIYKMLHFYSLYDL